MKIYVDGKSVATTTLSNTLSATTLGGGATLQLGRAYTPGTNYLNGVITNVRIHNTNLSASQVSDLYYNDVATNVEAAWLMTDGSGATLTAATGGVNGTITSDSWVTRTPMKTRTQATARTPIS